MMIKLLMVFAELERTSMIERVTQAYAYRKICKRPAVSIYAEDLKAMISECIGEKLSGIGIRAGRQKDTPEQNFLENQLDTARQNAGYECRKNIAMLMIHRIGIHRDGSAEVIWNL